MTEEKKKYLTNMLLNPIDPEDDSNDNITWDLDKINIHNEVIDHPAYIYGVHTVVELLDQVGNIGQVKDILQLLPGILDETIELLNVNE